MMLTRERLTQRYWQMERVVAPGLRYSQSTYEDTLTRHVRETTVWLDLGCGRRLLPPWRREAEEALVARSRRLVGIDVDHGALTDNSAIALKCLGSATTLPFADATFDLVTANMVIEHLEDPASQFREIARVMKPGGQFIFHTPNALGYPALLARAVPSAVKTRVARYVDGREAQDVYPTFYRANSARAIESLARASSLALVDLQFILTTAVFAIVLPIALLELLWLRMLMHERLKHLRTNLIATLQKGDVATARAG